MEFTKKSTKRDFPKVRLGTDILNHNKFETEFLENKQDDENVFDNEIDFKDKSSHELQSKQGLSLPIIEKTKPLMSLNLSFCETSKTSFTKLKNEVLASLVKKSFYKLKNGLTFQKIVNLKDFHYNIINDQAYFKMTTQKNVTRKKFLKILDFFNSLIINPYHPLTMIWNLIIFLMLLFMFIYIPLDVSFHSYFDKIYILLIYWTTLIVEVFDIIFQLNTGIFINGCLVKNRGKILINYLTNSFIFDIFGFISIISGLIIIYYEENIYIEMHSIKLVIFFKFKKFINLYYEIFQYFKLDNSFKNSFELFKLLFVSLFVAHIVACLWHYVALIGDSDQNNVKSWLIVAKIVNSQWDVQYLYSIYWAVTTMMTVGYGDITPTNPSEILFAIVAIIVGCAVFGYNMNSIGMILQKIYKEDNDFKENVMIMNNFMERKKIDKDLNMRVREYLKFLWNEKKTQHNKEELEIINSLNSNLKEELLLEAYGGFFKAFPMFYHNFTEKTLKKMVSFMKEVKFVPGDNVFTARELDDCSIYYINNGSLEYVVEGNEIVDQYSNSTTPMFSVFQTFKAGEVFGESSFFSGLRRDYTAKCKEYVNVFEIKRDDFIKVLSETPEDYEQFCMIKDQMIFSNQQEFIKIKCNSCGSLTHQSLHCPLLQYIADKEKIIRTNEFSNFQDRKIYKRSSNRQICSFRIKKEINKAANKFQKKLLISKLQMTSQIQSKIMKNNKIESKFFDSKCSLALSSEDIFVNCVEKSQSSLSNLEEKMGDRKATRDLSAIPEEKEKCLPSLIFTQTEESIGNNVKNNNGNRRSSANQQSISKENDKSNNHSERMKPNSMMFSVTKSEKNLINFNHGNILSNEPPFEKHFLFKRYFQKHNMDAVLKVYENKRRKTEFLKSINLTSTSPHRKIIENINEKLKNLGKYCFFSEEIKKKLIIYHEKKKKKGSFFEKEKKNDRELEDSSPRKSAFFKRKEFKNKDTFATLISKAIILTKKLKSSKQQKKKFNKV